MQNDEPQCIRACAAGNELEIEISRDSIRCFTSFFYYEYEYYYYYSPHKSAFQNTCIMRVGDQKLMINLEWPNYMDTSLWDWLRGPGSRLWEPLPAVNASIDFVLCMYRSSWWWQCAECWRLCEPAIHEGGIYHHRKARRRELFHLPRESRWSFVCASGI